MIVLPTKLQMGLVVMFTMAETVVLTGWLAVAGIAIQNYPQAAAFLCAGLLVEHTLAVVAGNSFNAQRAASAPQ